MRINALREKISSFLLFVFCSVLSLFVGLYLDSRSQNNGVLNAACSAGYVFYAISILLFLASPLNFLLTKPNRKITGIMKFTFTKSEANGRYNYRLETIKKRQPFDEISEINLLVPKKSYFILASKTS